MRAGSIRKSSKVMIRRGKSHQPSVRDVALSTTRIDLPSFGDCEPETVRALTAMTLGFLQNELSSDVVWLSMHAAEDMAKRAGVSEAEFRRVRDVMVNYWAKKKAANPIGGMF